MIRNHLTLAWRLFVRQREYSLLNVLGLATGLTCFIVLHVFVRYESTFDHHHARAGQTFRVVQHLKAAGSEHHWNTTAYPLAEAIRNDFSEPLVVTQIAGPGTRLLSVEQHGREALRFDQDNVLFADPFFFDAFDTDFIIGDQTTALADPRSVVLTETTAHRYFGTTSPEQVMGREILLNNRDRLTVTGIVKDPPGNTNYRYGAIIPYAFFKTHNPFPANNWSGNYQGTTFVVLPAQADIAQFEAKMARWKKQYLKPEDDQRISYALQPLSAIHTETLYGSPPAGYTMPAEILKAVEWTGVFILIIASVNFINLATAQATGRSKEVGIRKVIGGTRWELFRQFTGENLGLLLVALTISLALAQLAIFEVNSLLSVIHLNLSLEWRSTALISVIGIAVIFVAGLYPSLVMSSFHPAAVLKSKLCSPVAGGLSLRKALIVLQFSIVQIFVIGTIVIAVQMHYIRHTALGFNREAIMTTGIPDQARRAALHQAWSQDAGVQLISFNSGPPTATERRLGTSYWLPSGSQAASFEAEMKAMDEHYVDLYGLTLLAGRNFLRTADAFDEFIVNEKLIRAFGWTPEEAIGQKLVINEGAATIVGVVKDFHNNSMQEPISPCVMINWNAFLDNASLQLSRVNRNPGETLQFVAKTWQAFFPQEIYRYLFIDDFLEQNYVLENLIFDGFLAFSVLAVLIGCVGLYGLIRFVTIRRTKEVGIRKVLGASVTGVFLLFSREFFALVLIALLIASPLSGMAMQMWLSGFAYRIGMSWWMFASGGLVGMGVTLLTVGYQSLKTAAANPITALRYE